jgi:ABC-type multidrug transport system fused ATPase/permease subunit
MAVVFVSSFTAGLRGIIFNTMSATVSHAVRYDIFYFLVNKDVGFFDTHKTGETLSCLNSDTTVIENALGSHISMAIRANVTIIASLVIMFSISWRLTLVLVTCVIPILFMRIKLGAKMKAVQIEIQKKKAELNQVTEEALSNIRTVKAFATEKTEMARFGVRNEDTYKAGYKMSILDGLF